MIRRLIAWWMSAPCDEKTAALLFVGIWLLGAIVGLIDVARHH